MTAVSVIFSPKVASDWDPQKPLTTTKLNTLFDNTTNLHERLGGSYSSNTKDHSHNGIDSALVPVGPNYLRNGSFEDGTSGWTVTAYTGGTVAPTSTSLNGSGALAITSTVLANGGGDAIDNEYTPVTEGVNYDFKGEVKASVANVSCKAEIIWYDAAKAQISAASVYASSNTPTTATHFGTNLVAPATARFMRRKITGGVPATGTEVGTITFDGLISGFGGGRLVKFSIITTSNAVWPKQADTTKIIVQCFGGASGGGGGGAGDGFVGGAGGGGGGAYYPPSAWAVIDSPAATMSAVVGAGGTGGAGGIVFGGNGSAGGSGGTTSFNGVAVALGSTSGGSGGAAGGSGDSDGRAGSNGTGTSNGVGGAGGAVGGGGGGSPAAFSLAGGGGGGGGNYTNNGGAGGAGCAGFIYVWEYA